jgi:hypothetical protein
MDFTCVHCEDKSFTTLRGWKQHMSTKHGGYDEQDIARITGATASEDNVIARMSAFADTIGGGEPGGATGSGDDGQSAGTPASQPPASPRPPVVRVVKATPKRLKKILSAIPTKMLEGTGIELDSEDIEALEEAGDFLVEIFGVEFEIDQEKRVLHSRFWAFLWVGGVALLIYFKHRFKDVWTKVYEHYKKAAEEKEGDEEK